MPQPHSTIACISPGANISNTDIDISLHTRRDGSTTIVATTSGGAPPELNVKRLQKGHRFAQTADFRVAIERCVLTDSTDMCTDKRVEGSRAKVYRCAGAPFTLFLRHFFVDSTTSELRGVVWYADALV